VDAFVTEFGHARYRVPTSRNRRVLADAGVAP